MNSPFKYIYSFALLTVAALSLSACDDVLDVLPDNRTAIDSPKKVQQLLASAYPGASPSMLEELLGDNIVDNNVEVQGCHKSSYYVFQEECFQFEDIRTYTTGEDDTPYQVWDEFYKGIATCNDALQAIAKMEAENPSLKAELSASKGEALVVRAWLHFQLVNLFALQYKNEQQTDPGIPYCTTVENVVYVDYTDSVLTVPQVYKRIEQDLEAGLPLIDDTNYKVRAFRMNPQAAYALAARFYLYKRDWEKCEAYATKALGNMPANQLRNWKAMEDFASSEERKLWYNSYEAPCNFLLQPVFSVYDRMLTSGARHCFNGKKDTGDQKGSFQSYNPPSGVTVRTPGPNWSSINGPKCYQNGGFYISSQGQQFGIFFCSMLEYFEFTDKIAGIGWVHMFRRPFKAEETLLCRAEARFYLNRDQEAIDDLYLWTSSRLETDELTQQKINSFYGSPSRKNQWYHTFHLADAGWDKPADILRTEQNKPLIDCILHFRRIENLYEGLRWEDIKRYGITVEHRWQDMHETDVHYDSLTVNDPRRAMKYPLLVRTSGLDAQQHLLQKVEEDPKDAK